MPSTLITAIIPIIFTIGLGYFSGIHNHFNDDSSNTIISLVMTYALPLSLFSGLISMNRKLLLHSLPMALWLGLGMLGSFIILIIINLITIKKLDLSVLRALSIACPSVPFMGTSVLALIFGLSNSAFLVGICSIYINLVQVPVSVLMLSMAKEDHNHDSMKQFLMAFSKPLVWAPIIAFVLNLSGFQLAPKYLPIFNLLGQSAGGLAIFTVGITLFNQKFSLSMPMIMNVLQKNIGLPLVIWILMIIFKAPVPFQQMVIVTLAIPTATMPTMLGVQYHVHEEEMASTQLLSTVLSVLTMFVFMVLLKVS
ncbi:transporter [Philodulcilactobacillus myokoensis]|uniref:Transporter n=1 Tax=Philodulcilactobacillus myokoensis TaxID=2929573 RepID=A0A9W6EUX2_9LACO|nr:AEC family transporter [Philodulcilactobacillus myokoensis]GLB47619.1 transporter [Philodulcilactobacillus myokoensis]